MSISFSGLASGLDTSSWVESLVALKQAKVDTLEEQKETVLLSRETLNNIKSFFNSFRSVIEKVTDAKYGVVSMDIFAQKLAVSSNLNVLTASAATDAEEATYTVLVDNLATSTEAMSGLKSFNTIIQTETAAADTKLLDLGVKVGNIGINNNGVYNIIGIEENDTISSFIAKLRDIGVDASYNPNTGIFGINLDNDCIDDTLTVHKDGSVGTGILDVFHLEEKGGYESTFLQVTTSKTIVTTATEDTKLSEIGSIGTGNIQVNTGGGSHTVSVNGDKTLGELIEDLRNLGIDASLSEDGSLIIKDAEIVDSGGTGILDSLGLESEVGSKTQTTGGLTTVEVTTTTSAATGDTKLSELGTITNGNMLVKANGTTYTIGVSGSTTLSQLISALTSKGIDASLSEDGTLTIKDAEIIDNGTGILGALGLEGSVDSKNQTSVDLKTVQVTTTASAATGATKLSELGTIKSGNVLVKANGTTYTVAVSGTTTLSQLVSALTSKGIDAKLSSDGVLTIKDAEIVDSAGTGIANALGLQTEINSKTQTANNLSYKSVITTETSATGATKLGELETWKGTSQTLVAKSAAGKLTTITVTSTTTINDVVSKINSAGLSAALSSSGVLAVTGGQVTGVGAEILGIVSGSENTNSVWANGNTLYTQGVKYAVASNTLGELGISTTKPAGGYALAVFNSSNALVKEIAVTANTRIDDIFKSLGSYGISGTIADGRITLESGNGNYIKGVVAEGLGITTKTSVIVNSTSASSTSAIKYTVTQMVSGTTTFAQAGLNAAGKVMNVKTKENGVIKASITIDSNAKTFDNLFTQLSAQGVSASISNGVITFSSNQYYVDGSLADLLGVEAYSTSNAYTVGQSTTSTAQLMYTTAILATGAALIKDYITLDSNVSKNTIRIYANNNTSYKDFTITSSTTFDQMMTAMRNQGINVTLALTGILSFGTPTKGAYAADVAAGGVLSKLGIGANNTGVITLAVSQTSSSALTYKSENKTYFSCNSDVTLQNTKLGDILSMDAGKDYYIVKNQGSYSHKYLTVSPGNTISYQEIEYRPTVTVTVNSTMTIYQLQNACNYRGIDFDYYLGQQVGFYFNLDNILEFLSGSFMKDVLHAENSGHMAVIDNDYHHAGVTERTVTSRESLNLSAGSRFSDLGLGGNGSIDFSYAFQEISRVYNGITVYSQSTSSAAFYFDLNTTVQNFLDFLNNTIGVSAALSGGKLTIKQGSGTKKSILMSADSRGNHAEELLNIFKISLGSGVSYTQGATKGYSMNYYNRVVSTPVYKVSTVLAQATTSTKLVDMGIQEGEYTMFSYIDRSGTEAAKRNFMLTVNASTTVQDMLNRINSSSNLLNASFANGKLTITGKQTDNDHNAYITRFSSLFKNVFKLGDAGLDKTYQTTTLKKNTNSAVQTRQGAVPIGNIDGNTSGSNEASKTLRQVGLTSNATISMNNTDGKLTWKIITPNMRLEDFKKILTDYGVSVSFGNSKVTIGSLNDSEWIETMSDNLRNVLKLKNIGTGFTYEIIGNAAYENTSSRTIKTITTHTASGTTRLEQIDGFNGGNGNIIIHNEAGVMETVYINSTSTLNEFFSQIAAYGLTGSVNASGVVTINGKGRASISTASGGSNLVSLLKLSQSKASKTVTVNTTTAAISSTARIFASDDTQLGNLEYSNGTKLTFDSNGFAALVLQTKSHDGLLKNMTVNFTKTSTLGSVIQTLAGQGLNASIEASGLFSINTDKLSDFSVSGTLGAYLMGANYNKCYETRASEPLMSVKTSTLTAAATRETKLSDLGVTAGEYNIYKNGVKYTALISSDETVGTFMDTLAAFGIQAGLVNNGTSSKLVLQGSGDSYVAKSNSVSNTSNVVEKLFGTGAPSASYSYVGSELVSKTSTSTIAATGATALSNFGITTGEFNIFENGVKYTEYISADDTLESFMNKLQAHGIQAALINQGGSAKLMLTGNGNSYVAKSNSVSNVSNVVEKLFGTTSTVNNMTYTGSQQTTVVSTSTVSATGATSLSSLGVTSGEYYIYKDGVKYTALVASNETLGSLMDTLKSFGFQAALVDDGGSSKLVVIGSGDSYIAKSNNASNASNIVDKLFSGSAVSAAPARSMMRARAAAPAPGAPDTSYNYAGGMLIYTTITHTSTATEDTLLSAFDTPWGGTMLKSAGDLVLSVDGKNRLVKISETETFGSLIDKLNSIGVEAQIIGGKFYISEMNNVSIVASGTTSSIINPNANIHLNYKSSMDMFMESTAAIEKTTTIVEEATLSASNYADLNTTLETLNITGGTFSVYRNGQKATININSDSTFSDLRSQISSRFSDIDLKFDNGKLVIFSKTDGVEVKAGSTTDTSNMLSVTGLAMNEEGQAVSARQLFSVNENSVLTQAGLFRKADIKAGTFYVGEQVINITDKSTLNDIITQINSSDKSNATAWWDSINGRFVIKARTTGAALINIEAGTSNFTDVMGYTETEWYADGSVKFSRMMTEQQKIGDNARFSINGTSFTATSNTLTSDITRIKGLTVNLTGLTNGAAVTVKVEKDKETVAKSLSEIVDSYNKLMKNVDEAVARSGALHNQSMLKMLRNQIRNAMTASIGGDSVFKNLHAIGVSVSSANANNISTSNESIINLSFDKDSFLKAYSADAEAVRELLIGKGLKGAAGATEGVFTKVESIVENALSSVIGYFSIADEAYAREIKKIDNKIVKGTEAIEKYRARLNKKFNSMDMLISNMQNQYSSFLGA